MKILEMKIIYSVDRLMARYEYGRSVFLQYIYKRR